jgi:hypothetical protein
MCWRREDEGEVDVNPKRKRLRERWRVECNNRERKGTDERDRRGIYERRAVSAKAERVKMN